VCISASLARTRDAKPAAPLLKDSGLSASPARSTLAFVTDAFKNTPRTTCSFYTGTIALVMFYTHDVISLQDSWSCSVSTRWTCWDPVGRQTQSLALGGDQGPGCGWHARVPLQLGGVQSPPVGPGTGAGMQRAPGRVLEEDWKTDRLEVPGWRTAPA
jgi:hypothetical protein